MIKKATFNELLDKEKVVNIHTRKFQILDTEMLKVEIGESPSVMHQIFQTQDSNNFNLKKNRVFKPGNPKTVYYGTETVSVLGPKLWIILPDKYKNSTSLKEFKSKIKNWVLKLPMSFIKDTHTKCWLISLVLFILLRFGWNQLVLRMLKYET